MNQKRLGGGVISDLSNNGHVLPNLANACTKFAAWRRPTAFYRLDEIGFERLAAAELMCELGNVSRRGFKAIHRYIRRIGAVPTAVELPDARTIKQSVRQACLRIQGADKKEAKFVVEAGPGVPAQTVTFEVFIIQCCEFLVNNLHYSGRTLWSSVWRCSWIIALLHLKIYFGKRRTERRTANWIMSKSIEMDSGCGLGKK